MKNFLKNSIEKLDLVAWLLVLCFFCGSALLFGGNLLLATVGAVGVIVAMLLIGISIEIIIESLKNTKGIGTLTGFITNGPEAVCLLVGLVAGDIIFAASTPLGSNFMNPILLLVAAIVCGQFSRLFRSNRLYTITTVSLTTFAAGGFFLLPRSFYLYWLAASVVVSSTLFYLRPMETELPLEEPHSFNPNYWFLPSIGILVVSGYYLDPIVSFAAANSLAPKGVIGFIVLATLTSWPEFKSCLGLLRRKKILAAILNITVSNITNIWLAAIGVATFLAGF
ncbi:sodium:proton exchanger [Desulforhopalus singaporensis]|uniref:Cation:H+ antiporter n=1 Tax=Desulforhopalus singaporensis TaxID=91360 RepID=A0A1H0MPC8_9BACT|nr:sodium:proton exchanger [Desulforhopalus singaporensis]SDO82309.1 cation:H+ antiporter [Desulforhopalus singaporensis]